METVCQAHLVILAEHFKPVATPATKDSLPQDPDPVSFVVLMEHGVDQSQSVQGFSVNQSFLTLIQSLKDSVTLVMLVLHAQLHVTQVLLLLSQKFSIVLFKELGVKNFLSVSESNVLFDPLLPPPVLLLQDRR